MKVTPALSASRLDLDAEQLPPTIQTQASVITTQTIAYCQDAFDRSRFFQLLQAGHLTPPLLQYVFLQYRFWRDRLHQWFGLCILKASSCTDPAQKTALLSLSDHIFTDLKDGHNEMYDDFLAAIGLQAADIATAQRSAATTLYERSLFDDFGYESDNFYETLAALSGRELCAAIRNVKLLQSYFDPHHLQPPLWLSLHAELEIDHFQATLYPILSSLQTPIPQIRPAIERGIDRHMQYFDHLLEEYGAGGGGEEGGREGVWAESEGGREGED